MARKRKDDFIQNYRFHVIESTGTFLDSTAGFKTCSTPELTSAIAEYRDGLQLYTVKQPGLPTVGNCTLGQGAATRTSQFFTWLRNTIEGNEYRADLEIDVYDNSPQAKKNVVKQIVLFETFPIRNKIIGDLDSTNADINVRELELAVEQVGEAL